MLSPSGLLPVALAISAAGLFGMTVTLSKRGLRHGGAQTGTVVVIATTCFIYWLSSPFWMRADYWLGLGFWIFVLGGIMHPMMSTYLSLEATDRTDPTIAATFAATAPLFAALTAILFLGESVSLSVGIGTLAIVLGIMSLTWSHRKVGPLIRTALLLASGAALIRGLNDTVGKWGLALLPSPMMAGCVSFSVSLVGILLIHRIRQGTFKVSMPPAGLRYFMLSGASLAGAIFCLYSALGRGQVVVVSPLVNASPLFTMLTAFLLKEEQLSPRAIVGVFAVLGGIAIISIANA